MDSEEVALVGEIDGALSRNEGTETKTVPTPTVLGPGWCPGGYKPEISAYGCFPHMHGTKSSR